MNILIAPDTFKDCLPALEVARNLQSGILKALPGAVVRIMPVADGGEGTVAAVMEATHGRWIETLVADPLFREVKAKYGVTGDGSTAVIEMASASGIELLRNAERDPLKTTTYGTGQLILHALDRGCPTIMVGLGGSATIDCGLGMASALGIVFLDKRGRTLEPTGGCIGKVQTIKTDRLDHRIGKTVILAACDVDNPLTGRKGAAITYGIQKGGDVATLRVLDRDMKRFAGLVREQLGKEMEHLPGAGAAGGLGAGLSVFLGARLAGGFELVAGMIQLEEAIREADLVVTGEGKLDAQTLHGKAPFGVAKLARKQGKKTIGVAGIVEDTAGDNFGGLFSHLIPIHHPPREKTWSMEHASMLLEQAGEEIAGLVD